MIRPLASAILPLLRCMDAEQAHGLALRALRCGLAGRDTTPDDPALAITVLGRRFANPIGLAAGFDKNAVAVARADAARVRLRGDRHRHAPPAARQSAPAAVPAGAGPRGHQPPGVQQRRARRLSPQPCGAGATARWRCSAPMSASTRTAPIRYATIPRWSPPSRRTGGLRGDQRVLAQHARAARPARRGAASRHPARRRRRCRTARRCW